MGSSLPLAMVPTKSGTQQTFKMSVYFIYSLSRKRQHTCTLPVSTAPWLTMPIPYSSQMGTGCLLLVFPSDFLYVLSQAGMPTWPSSEHMQPSSNTMTYCIKIKYFKKYQETHLNQSTLLKMLKHLICVLHILVKIQLIIHYIIRSRES